MADLSLTLPNILFILIAALCQSFGLLLSFNQHLEPRFRSSVVLAGYIIVDLIVIVTFGMTPLSVRSFSTPFFFLLATLFLYRGTVFKKALINTFLFLIIDLLQLLLLACLEILQIPFHDIINSKILTFFVAIILMNIVQILLSRLLRSLLPPSIVSAPQGEGILFLTVLSLFCAVSCLGAIAYLTMENSFFTGIGLCAGIIVLFAGVLILLWIFKRTERISQEESKQALLQKEWELSVKRDAQAKQYRSDVENLEHRMSGILDEIADLIQEQKSGEALEYIDRNLSEVQKVMRPQNLKNPIADYFLNELKERCKPENINLSVSIELPQVAGIDDLDFCTVLSNMLDNAVKACKDVRKKRYIRLTIHKNDNILFIGCENSKSSIPQQYQPKRKIGHFGLSNIRETVRKYGGDVEINDEPEKFHIQALLYC